MSEVSDKALAYAALILADEGIEITVCTSLDRYPSPSGPPR
jgi:hypothetical protein